jgi:hypothetical protein
MGRCPEGLAAALQRQLAPTGFIPKRQDRDAGGEGSTDIGSVPIECCDGMLVPVTDFFYFRENHEQAFDN